MSNIIEFNPVYFKYRKMWYEDRWKFSGKMVNLTINKSSGSLSEEDKETLEILNRIVEEHDGKWLDSSPTKKIKKRG